MYGNWVETDWVLKNIPSDYKVIIVGDASMEPSELFGSSYYNYGARNETPGIEYLKRFKEKYKHLVWLNPIVDLGWRTGYWRQTYDAIKAEFDMYPLTVASLDKAIKKLMVSK